jgi:branched-subunit amino acid transport protein
LDNLFLAVLGVAIVTYLPRMIPMALLSNLKLPTFLKRFLGFIPYTALSALIFPAILSSTSSVESALLGGSIAVGLAYFNTNLFLVVCSGIGGVLIWELLI